MSEPSRRSAPLPRDWRRRRARILKRDRHRCQLRYPGICIGTATHVDHTLAEHLGGTHDESNLAAACEPCHNHKSAREARAAQHPRKRPAEPHPGDLSP